MATEHVTNTSAPATSAEASERIPTVLEGGATESPCYRLRDFDCPPSPRLSSVDASSPSSPAGERIASPTRRQSLTMPAPAKASPVLPTAKAWVCEGGGDPDPKPPPVNGRRWRQHVAALLATLGSVSVGYVDGWSANALPWLQSPPSYVVRNDTTTKTGNGTAFLSRVENGVLRSLTDEEASWISALVAMGALVGSPPAAILANRIGRKNTLLLMAIPCLASWVTIVFASHTLALLYIARFTLGFIMGVVCVVQPLYNEEIAEVSVRGALGVYQNLMVTLGILFSYVVGAFVPYVWMAAVPCAIPILIGATFVWMPESPVYLLTIGEEKKAERALRWLRGREADLGPELRRLAATAAVRQQAASGTWRERLKQVGASMTSPNARAVAIVFGLMAFRQLSGINAIVFNTVEIFSVANRTEAPYDTMVIGAVEVASTFSASLLVDRLGRRPLLLFSGVGTALCHSGLAAYFMLQDSSVELDEGLSWLPLLILASFIVVFACGFGPLPWFMMAELIPAEDKGWAAGFTGFLNWMCMFLVVKLFTTSVAHIGAGLTFCVFAFNCAAATLFVAFCVPETKGKTLEEIQKEIRGE